MTTNIPIYRAKKIDSDEYVIFNSFYEYENKCYAINKIINQTIDGWFTNVMIPLTFRIVPTTIAIHFPNMTDSQGNKIFASLSEDGKGGDIVEGKCRDVNGDTITRLHKPLPYKGLVRFYKETLMSVVIETKDEIIEKTKGWSTPIYVNRGKALRWCDCRQDIKVIGIQE